jgi:hypothetical protein
LRRYTLSIVTIRRIQVECYAGSRADESPRRVSIEGRSHTIRQLLSESIEESFGERERTHRYRVLTDQGFVLEIIRTAGGEWFLQSIKRADK